MVVGGSTLVQIWGTLLWPRVIGPDLVKWWFSWVWSDDISFTFGAVEVQLVVARGCSKGYEVVRVVEFSIVQVWFSCGWQVVQFDVA